MYEFVDNRTWKYTENAGIASGSSGSLVAGRVRLRVGGSALLRQREAISAARGNL